MEMYLEKCSFEEYTAAKDAAQEYCESTGNAVTIYIENDIVDNVTYEYDEDDRAFCCLHSEEDRILTSIFPEEYETLWVQQCIADTKAKLAEVEKEIVKLNVCKPRLGCHSVEDVDDAYQAMLEWTWEMRDLKNLKEALEFDLYALNK